LIGLDLKPKDQAIGKKDRYVVDSFIKTGGMGNIYRGHSLKGLDVVIKTPILDHPDGMGNVRLQKIKTEAEILNDKDLIKHRNIVSYVDESEDESNYFLVLGYIDGHRMKDYVRKPLVEAEAIKFIRALLNTVSFLHKKGILHRDINNKNILFRRGHDGIVRLDDFVLIDFGIATREWSPSTMREKVTVGGTKHWSAPEQFSSSSITSPSSDIYSVGCMLFYLLTGMEPYLYINEDRAFRMSPEIERYISRETAEIIKVSTSPDPLDRYQTAEDMLTVLRGIVTPYLMVSNRKHVLGSVTDIGRLHVCDENCRSKGFTRPLDLSLQNALKPHISKHHARIYVEPNKRVFIVDLGSLNKTAIRRQGGKFEILIPNKSYELEEGDEIAIVYNEKLGPYRTLSFNKK